MAKRVEVRVVTVLDIRYLGVSSIIGFRNQASVQGRSSHLVFRNVATQQ